MVGRPREFDPDLVLNAAMEAFWAKGYQATSLADLMAATGLHKGSLYQAFGDKHSLFIQALKRYLDGMHREKTQILAAAKTPLDGLRNVAHGLVDMLDDDDAHPRGCMAINALVELAPHDVEVQEVMGDHIMRMRRSLEGAIAQAQAAGQINGERPPELVASMMLTFIAGLGTTIKGAVRKSDAHQLVDAFLEAMF